MASDKGDNKKQTPFTPQVKSGGNKREEMRKKHNKEIIQKMRDGDPLTNFDSMSSWFPPRPTIEKDKDLMDQLYAGKPTPTTAKKKQADQADTQQNETTKEVNDKPVVKKSNKVRVLRSVD